MAAAAVAYAAFLQDLNGLGIDNVHHIIGGGLKLLKCQKEFSATQSQAQDLHVIRLLNDNMIEFADIVVQNVAGQPAWNATPAREREWWVLHGNKITERLAIILRGEATESGVPASAIAEGKMPSVDDCLRIFNSVEWRRVKNHIAADDAQSALLEAQNAGEVGQLIMMAKLRQPASKSLSSSTITHERAEINARITEWVALEDVANESKLKAAFVNRHHFLVGFA